MKNISIKSITIMLLVTAMPMSVSCGKDAEVVHETVAEAPAPATEDPGKWNTVVIKKKPPVDSPGAEKKIERVSGNETRMSASDQTNLELVLDDLMTATR